MNMKYLVFILYFYFSSIWIYSQSNTLLPIAVYVPNDQLISSESRAVLESKLQTLITDEGIGANKESRFIITGKIGIVGKEYTSTSPVMIASTLNVFLCIGDGIDGTLFSSINITLKGVGTTEIKSINSALSKLNIKSENISDFLKKGKNKIFQYYAQNCDLLIQKAQISSSKEDYNKSLNELANIFCIDTVCIQKVNKVTLEVYQKKIDLECDLLLNQAKILWQSSLDLTGAEKASEKLKLINPNSHCYVESQKLVEEIKTRIFEISQREWEFELQKVENQFTLDAMQIEAARQIGVAYGENQPDQIIEYNINGWW